MRKILTITLALALFLAYFIVSSNTNGNASDVKITHNQDGSVKYTFPDGRTKTISMDGKTPYGMDITEKKEKVKKNKFIVEIIYSKMHSDDNMNKYTKRFYDTLISQIRKKLSATDGSDNSMKILISNCKYCRTGYCKRSKKIGFTLLVYKNDKKKEEFTIPFSDIMNKKTFEKTAISASDRIFH